MGIELKSAHLKRYAEVARLLWKHGRSDLVKQSGLDRALEVHDKNGAAPADACELANDLEAMGPAFIKLGQVLSTRADLLPVSYLGVLARLQDKVEPVPFDAVADVIREELDKPLARLFAEIEQEPLASASLGQVHRARVHDGREVAVKVQRPGAREQVLEDACVLREIAAFLEGHSDTARRFNVVAIAEEFSRALVRELDYRQEARNLCLLGGNLEGFERIVVPEPLDELTTERVLTMDYVRGHKVSRIAVLRRPEVDGAELADELFRAYLKQVLVDGFFHADPHPGNVFLTEGGRIALLDLGMVAQVTPAVQADLLRWILAVGEGDAEEAAEIALALGARPSDRFDSGGFRAKFAQLVADQRIARPEKIEFGRTVLATARLSAEWGVTLPREFTMLGKALVNLQHVSSILDPAFDPHAAIRRHASEIAQRQMWKRLSPSNLLKIAAETKDLAEAMPRRLGRILDTVSQNRLRLKVDAIDETRLLQGLQKIANRITLGLVLAALIIGGAMLMRVDSGTRILGYPALAVLLFLAAAGGGIALSVAIVVGDVKSRRRR